MIGRLALVLLAIALPLHAQMAPRPFGARALHMRVVDAETGGPLQGAIVVARWNWRVFYPGGFHSSARLDDEGDVLHSGEAVTDPEGRFVIDGYATVRAKGAVDEGAPYLAVFLPGYEPWDGNLGDRRSDIRLKRSAAPAAAYAASIGRMQGDSQGGLHWLSPKTDWKAMPRMVHALHREKLRLGEDGVAVRSAHRLVGISGVGKIVDARTGAGIRAEDKLPGEPYPPGVAWISWTMRRVNGTPGTMRLTYSRMVPVGESASEVNISAWTLPGPDIAIPGWEAARDIPPTVRIYGWGYRRSPEVQWRLAGGETVRLERVPASREAVLENVRALRRDVDAVLEENRAEAIRDHRPLLALLAAECRALTPDLRAGICFPESSDVAAELRKRELYARFDRIPEDGPEIGRRVAPAASRNEAQRAVAAPSAAGAMAVAPHGAPSPPRKVGGFSIEPAR